MPSGAPKPTSKPSIHVRVYPAFRDVVKAAFVRKAAWAGLAVEAEAFSTETYPETPSNSPLSKGRTGQGTATGTPSSSPPSTSLRAGFVKGRTREQRDVSVVVADDETLRELNREFRGFDEVTDVLSFGEESDASLTDPDAEFPEFPDIPDEPAALGEIVLSYPLAVKQAGEHNVTVEEEVALLIVHGVLHLLGYDHAEPDDEAAMKALEAKALAVVFPEGNRNKGGVEQGGA